MSEPPFQRNNAPREPMDAPEEKALEAFLREHDPAEPVGEGFSPRQRSRVVRYMEHPILATIYLHHRTAALTGAVLVVALTILLLIWWKMVRPVEPLPPVRFDVEQKLPALTPEPEPAPELPLPDISSDTFLHHSEDTLPSPPAPSDEAFFNGAPF